MKAVIYARTNSQSDNIQIQVEQCKEFASDNGYEIDHYFLDENISGVAYKAQLSAVETYIENNPGYRIIALNPDRISRKQDELITFIEYIREIGSDIVFVNV